MINNILHTIGSRFFISMLNLILLFITTKLMGAEAKGAISLLVLNLSLTAIFSGLFGGPSLVYLVPRLPLKNIVILNYSWSILAAIGIASISIIGLIPSEVGWSRLFILGLMECIIAANAMIILGQQRIKAHNQIMMMKTLSAVLLLVILVFYGTTLIFDHFVLAYGIGLTLSLLLSFFHLFKSYPNHSKPATNICHAAKFSFKYGSLVQIGNVSQLLNYRLSFYLLEMLISPPSVALIRIGIYSASLQVAEALWQFARSVSTVQYARVSNATDNHASLAISIRLGKLNYLVTTLGIGILLLIPKGLYGDLFGIEFMEIKSHLYFLSIGIIALSLSNAFSHYFAGIGMHSINTFSSIFGLILTILIGYSSIKYFGTIGAAATASFVYFAQTFYQFLMLKKTEGVQLKDLIINRIDVQFGIQVCKSILQVRKSNQH